MNVKNPIGGFATQLLVKLKVTNRTTTDENYRYAFQGQELDGETEMEAFQLRLWDGRIGRWLSVDPYGQYASPYLGMGNNPVNGIDVDGGIFILGKLTKGQRKLWNQYISKIKGTKYGKYVYDKIQNNKNFIVNVVWEADHEGRYGDYFFADDEPTLMGDCGMYLSFSDKVSPQLNNALKVEERLGGGTYNHEAWIKTGHEMYHAYQRLKKRHLKDDQINKEKDAVRFQNYLKTNSEGGNLRKGYLKDNNVYKIDGALDEPMNMNKELEHMYEQLRLFVPQRLDNFPAMHFKVKIPKSNCGC